MARGFNVSPTYGNSIFWGDGEGFGGGYCGSEYETKVEGSLANYVLERFEIPSDVTAGSILQGMDIKSQDAMSTLRLSLLADSDGSKFFEVYGNGKGRARQVEVGTSEAEGLDEDDLLFTNVLKSSQPYIDYVVCRPRKPIPTRYTGGTVNIMGPNGGFASQLRFDCLLDLNNSKNAAFGKEAWAEFGLSPQNDIIKEQLRGLVRRSKWEQLVGYRVNFPSIPRYATVSVAQTSPNTIKLPNVGWSDTTVSISNNEPDTGQITDISSISMTSAPVLDIKTKAELVKMASQLGYSAFSSQTEEDALDNNSYYTLLCSECGLNSLPRGQNWWILPVGGDPYSARIAVRESEGSAVSAAAFGGALSTFESGNSLAFNDSYRANNRYISSWQDVFNAIATGPGAGNINYPLMSTDTNVFQAASLHGNLVAGFGGNYGMEVFSLDLNITKQKSSMQIRSQQNDAFSIANHCAQHGILQTAIIVQEKPPIPSVNGISDPPPTPPNNPEDSYCPDTLLDTLEGSIMEISCPFLTNSQVNQFCSNILTQIRLSAEEDESGSYTYKKGGYNVFPGMLYKGQIIHTIEFSYSDRDSQITTVTTGPRFYQPGSAGSDSTYIKRSETLNKTGTVIGSNSAQGKFSVYIEGLGTYDALNGVIDSVHVGDKVEVKILNYPVER